MPLISPRKQMQFLYRRAAGPDDFPWHEDKPSRLLEEAIASRPTKGRALDLGCGSGFYTVHLAQQGFEVTGVDFVPDAIAMARERATAAGVAVELVEADVLEWESPSRSSWCSTAECSTSCGPATWPNTGDGCSAGSHRTGTTCSTTRSSAGRAIGVRSTHQAQRGGDPGAVRARPGASRARALRRPGAAAGRALALLRRVLVSPSRLAGTRGPDIIDGATGDDTIEVAAAATCSAAATATTSSSRVPARTESRATPGTRLSRPPRLLATGAGSPAAPVAASGCIAPAPGAASLSSPCGGSGRRSRRRA